MDEKLQFEVKLRSITHLGRKLYDNLAAAIAELVANSWDAYATEVNIVFSDEKIVFEDNGIGMNYDELTRRYCPIGKEKTLDGIRIPEGMTLRPPMGKKGIGKLAAFSIGDVYDVITKVSKESEVRKFTLEYEKMKSHDGLFDVKVENVESDNDYFNELKSSGFVVEIHALRKKITSRTINSLNKRISRRFAILSSNYKFKVTINGEVVQFDESYINDKIQYLWIFSNNDEQKKLIQDSFKLNDPEYLEKPVNVNYIDKAVICKNCPDENIEGKCLKMDHRESLLQGDILDDDCMIYGWLGTFAHNGDTKSPEGDNLNTLQVLFNGKIADEDLLRKIPGKEVAKSYIHGRIHADFIDKLDDPITSSRQGLDESVPEIGALICYMYKHVRTTINYWNDQRGKTQRDSIFKRYPDVKNWYDHHSINDDSKRVIDKFFKEVGKVDFVDSDVEKTVIKNTILAFEDAKYLNKLFKLNDMLDQEQKIETIVMQFNDLSRLEANRYRQILQNRFKVVDKLNGAIKNNDKEKVLHTLIYENMWLVDPHWDDQKDISRSEESLKNAFLENDPKLKDKRFDILFRKPHESNYPVLIELKRPDAKSYTPDYYSALGQVSKYRKSAAEYYRKYESIDIRPGDIPVVFIWENNDKFEDLKQDELEEKMRSENFKILRYSKIIDNVKSQYKEFLDADKDLEINVGFLMTDQWTID